MATNLFSPTGDGGAASWCREPEDGQLLASAKSGQAAAFAELCQPHAEKILRVTYRITKNQEDAEDAVQDSLFEALLNIEQFGGRSGFSTWLTSIAINSALMILRKRRDFSEIPGEDWCVTCPWLGYQYFPEDGASPLPFIEKGCTFQTRIVDGTRVDRSQTEPARHSDRALANRYLMRCHD